MVLFSHSAQLVHYDSKDKENYYENHKQERSFGTKIIFSILIRHFLYSNAWRS